MHVTIDSKCRSNDIHLAQSGFVQLCSWVRGGLSFNGVEARHLNRHLHTRTDIIVVVGAALFRPKTALACHYWKYRISRLPPCCRASVPSWRKASVVERGCVMQRQILHANPSCAVEDAYCLCDARNMCLRDGDCDRSCRLRRNLQHRAALSEPHMRECCHSPKVSIDSKSAHSACLSRATSPAVACQAAMNGPGRWPCQHRATIPMACMVYGSLASKWRL